MSLSIERIEPPDAGAWDHAWRECDYATFFHSRHWLELFDAYSGGAWRNDSRAVTFSDGTVAFVTLLRKPRLRGLVATYETGPRGTYGGWLSADELGEDHARLLVETMRELGNVTWYTNPYDANAGVIHAAATQPDVTDAMVFDGDFDALFRTWSKGHRAAVKQAQRSGIEVRVAEGVDDWKAYFGAYEDSLKRWGEAAHTPYRWDLFERLAKLPPSLARLWLAVHEGRVVAGAVCFYARRHVVYWHGSAYADYFKKRPVNLLVHAAARDACERGFRWFDFNPSGGLEGVRAFKTSFGTTEFACPTVKCETPLVRLLRRTLKR